MPWEAFESGSSVGLEGSEGGIILRDEEHEAGARITLEKCERPPFAITCGLYGTMVHTAFATTEHESILQYEAMKAGLGRLIALWPDEDASDEDMAEFYRAVSDFVDRF